MGKTKRYVNKDEDTITLGEVYRGLGQLRDDLAGLRSENASRFDTLNRVMGERLLSRELYQVAHEALQKEVTELELRVTGGENARRNLWLTVLGSIVAGITTNIFLFIHIGNIH